MDTLMNEVPRPTFADLVLTAASRTPGGVLLADDRAGMARRGLSMGLDEIDVRTVLEGVPSRDRITRGIE